MTPAGQHDGCSLGIIGAGRKRQASLASAADERAILQGCGNRAGVVLGVPAIAQEGRRDTGGRQQRFGRTVLLA